MVVKTTLLAILLIIPCNAISQDIGIQVVNPDNKKTYSYVLDTDSFDLDKGNFSGGLVSSKNSGKYSISNNTLFIQKTKLHDATRILFETSFNGYDLLIVRDFYNSFSNPIKWLSALAGHPIQGNKIYAIKVANGQLVDSQKILKVEPSSPSLHVLVRE